MNAPMFSIITVCYNSSNTIRKTMEAVLKQSYEDYEYLIVDGASTDDTLAVVNSFKDAFSGRLRVLSEKDCGLWDAMNKGIGLSRGKIIGIINSDDWYASYTLSEVSKIYEEANADNIIIMGDLVRVDQKTEAPIYRYYFSQKKIDNKHYFGHPTMFIAKTVYDRVGVYDLNYTMLADADFQCRAYADSTIKWRLSDKVFTYMRAGGISDKSNLSIWCKQYVSLRVKYKNENLIKAKVSVFFDVYGRALKNMLPIKIQAVLYNVVRMKWIASGKKVRKGNE